MSVKRFPNPFKFCEYYVDDFMQEADFKKINMHGMYETLQDLKKIIEDNFQRVNYMTYDIEYHGWHGEVAQNMHKIENALVKRMLEMYVICQMALGEDVYETDGETHGTTKPL